MTGAGDFFTPSEDRNALFRPSRSIDGDLSKFQNAEGTQLREVLSPAAALDVEKQEKYTSPEGPGPSRNFYSQHAFSNRIDVNDYVFRIMVAEAVCQEKKKR